MERPIGWGGVAAHLVCLELFLRTSLLFGDPKYRVLQVMTYHQVGKYKTASVTRKDVVTTELLCLAEAGDGIQDMKEIIRPLAKRCDFKSSVQTFDTSTYSHIHLIPPPTAMPHNLSQTSPAVMLENI